MLTSISIIAMAIAIDPVTTPCHDGADLRLSSETPYNPKPQESEYPKALKPKTPRLQNAINTTPIAHAEVQLYVWLIWRNLAPKARLTGSRRELPALL